jgi:hypothetical protein
MEAPDIATRSDLLVSYGAAIDDAAQNGLPVSGEARHPGRRTPSRAGRLTYTSMHRASRPRQLKKGLGPALQRPCGRIGAGLSACHPSEKEEKKKKGVLAAVVFSVRLTAPPAPARAVREAF